MVNFLNIFNSQNKIKKFYEFVSRKENDKKILVIRCGRIGDVVFITPVLNRLVRTFPEAKIDVLVSDSSKDVLVNFPGIKNIIPLAGNLSLIKQIYFFLGLRKNKYDILLNQEVNSHYTIMGKLTGAKYLIGFYNKSDYLLDIVFHRDGHAVKAEQGTVKSWTNSPGIEVTSLYADEKESMKARQLLENNGLSVDDFIVCIQVGCSEKTSVRQWELNKISKLADILIENYNVKTIFTGTVQDEPEVEKVMHQMNNDAVSLVGKTSVRQLIALLKYVKLVIGPDTGTLHLANALNVPVVMYMGWADPEDTGPYDITGDSKVVSVKLDCLPCRHMDPKPAQWEECKIMRPALCMKLLQVNQVLNAVELILNKRYNVILKR